MAHLCAFFRTTPDVVRSWDGHTLEAMIEAMTRGGD